MDAFFASVEQRDHPELRGKPVAVGGDQDRGVVAAASYEAREYGVHSAMPSRVAARKCPQLIFVPHRFDVYKEVSSQIRSIFREYTDLVEPLSLDEAFLDVTHNKRGMRSATLIAEEIRQRIFETTQLTASAGVSVNKFLAKVASDQNKPNGLTLIAPADVDAFIAALPIRKFFGVGPATAEKMLRMGIHVGGDLRQYSKGALEQMFGKAGSYFWDICRGIDDRPVRPDRIPKSVSVETTFENDLTELPAMSKVLTNLTERVVKRLDSAEMKGRTLSLKFRYADFSVHTRSKTIAEYTSSAAVILDVIHGLLHQDPLEQPVRLLGVGVSQLNVLNETDDAPVQLTLDF
jgi:DNA polymerase-4